VPIESLFPQGGGCIKLAAYSGWSRVMGIDAVRGPPHCNLTDKCCPRVSFPRCPGRPAVSLTELILDLVGEVSGQFGSLCEIVAPDRIGSEG
jgi:hypothetical protein